MNQSTSEAHEIVIEPIAPWRVIDLDEVRQYRDLFYFIVWRNIKVAYAQSVGGISWAVIQPAIQVLVFYLAFGKVVGVDTDGLPPLLFYTVAVIPWSYMSGTMGGSAGSLVSNAHLLGKIYIPRIIFPVGPVLSGLVGFFVSLVLIVLAMAWYRVVPTTNMLLLPVVFLTMLAVPLGVGLWLSSLAIRFRDVNIAMTYFMRMLIYTAPIMYGSSYITESVRPWYVLNPIVGVIEGYRSCLLGIPIYWDSLIPSVVVSLFLLVTGAVYFHRMERIVVDVI